MPLIRLLQLHRTTVADLAAAALAVAILSAAGVELTWWERGVPLFLILLLGRTAGGSVSEPPRGACSRWLPLLAMAVGCGLIWWLVFDRPAAAGAAFGASFAGLRAGFSMLRWLSRRRMLFNDDRLHAPRWLQVALAQTALPEPSVSSPHPPPLRFRIMLVAVIGLTALLHFAIAHVPGAPWVNREPVGYYALQTAGFLSGQLHAAIEPRPELLALANPYDPVANAPYRVHDMTLWQGRYYLYFGVAPIFLLILPFRLLTGLYLSEPAVVAVFTSLGFAGAALVVMEWRRRCFPRVGAGLTALLLVCLALSSPTLLLNQLAQFYQVPIACAYALVMVATWAALRTVSRPSRPLVGLAVTGSLLALSLAARPNYILATLALVILAHHVWRSESGPHRRTRLLPTLTVALAPVGLVGMALLVYNWRRFGSPFEFGMRYQLAGESFVHFTSLHPRHLLPHSLEYLWAPGWWRPYFPFFETRPEAPFGLLRFLPLGWLGLAGALLALPPRLAAVPGPTQTMVRFVLAIAVANLVMLSLFFYAPMLRYLADVAPAILLLGVVAAMAGVQRFGRFHWVRAGVAVLAIASTGPTLATLIQRAPWAQAPWTRGFNYPTHWVQHLLGHEHGPVRLQVNVPKQPTTNPIVLVHTGRTEDRFNQLRLYVHSPDTVQLAYFHAGLGELRSAVLPMPPDGLLDLELHSGALLPPPSHPVFRGWDPAAVAVSHRRLELRLNSRPILSAALQAYPSRYGEWRQPAHAAVAHLQQLPLEQPSVIPTLHGPIDQPWRLRLQLPALPAGPEPLLATGRGRSSDLLYVMYGPGPTVRFGFDHFGGAGHLSEAFAYDPLEEHVLDVWFAPAAVANERIVGDESNLARRLFLRFNRDTVFDLPVIIHPTEGHPTVIGANLHGAGSAGSAFSGRVLAIEAARPALASHL
jgi:hypothetical protein